MLEKRKGQLSIFLVIGAILVLVTGFLFASSQFEFFQSYDTRMKNQISDVVDQCVFESTDRGLFLLGFQGGYIEIPEEKAQIPGEHIDFGLKIPNWDSEDGDVPTISSMEFELREFILDDSIGCITSNLNSLAEFLSITVAEDQMRVDIEINEQNTIAQVMLPITFSEGNSEEIQSIEDFYVRVDSVRLGDMYSLASQIYSLEQGSTFMEDLVLDQIFSAGDYSSALSMPSQGMYFTCSPRVWTFFQLQENLANLNNNNFKYLYFEGTAGIDDVFEANLGDRDDLKEYYEKNYVFPLDDRKSSFRDYRVEVLMPSTEITGEEGILTRYPFRAFDVNPSSGGLVRPMDMDVDAGVFQVPIPCVQIFHHTYTLDYDLIIRITDLNQDGELYTFQFPLRIEVENNNPKQSLPQLPFTVEPATATDEVFCSDESRQYPLQIFALDAVNQEPLQDVDITYQCINLRCDMGSTQRPTFDGIDRPGSDAYLETDFPFCAGGRVIAEKDGYHRAEIRIDTDETLLNRDTTVYHDVEMIPLRTYDIEISSFLMVDRESRQGFRVFTEEEGSIYVQVENDKYEFSSQAIWPNEGEFLHELSFLDQEDVAYNVSVYFVDENYDLRGMMVMEDEILEVSGNTVEFVVPTQSSAIGPEEYQEFVEFMETSIETDIYGVNFS